MTSSAQDNLSGADEHTVALWLFDESLYPNCILTDASVYEHDLRLQSAFSKWWHEVEGEGEPPEPPLHVAGKYGLVEGRFGNALYTPAESSADVVWPDRSQRYADNVYMSDRGNEVPDRLNLGYLDYTIEFWFKAIGSQDEHGVIFEVRNDHHRTTADMVNALFIDPGRSSFSVSSKTYSRDPYDFKLTIPTDTARISDGEWHHLAFTYTAVERQMRHYVDGALQSLPGKGTFLPPQNILVSLDIARNLEAAIDEYRISDVVRYSGDFTPPGSFSRNIAHPRPPNKPSGPPLLFDSRNPVAGPVQLGARKHLFIDDALIDSMDNVELTLNPVVPVETNFRNTEAWEPTPRFGSTIPDPCTIWDDDGVLKMIYTNGGMWGAREHAICYATSTDGINWEKPVLNLKSWGGNTDNNILLRNAAQGSVFIDANPNTPPDEKYKFVAWNFYWGFYVFTSADGIHWRRNETCLLPFDPDGSNTTFWDDQAGIYRTYIRAAFDKLDSFRPMERGAFRAVARLETPELMEPWSFTPTERPNLDLTQAKPVKGELPIVDTAGQVYRFKAHKYEWAPDTYVAFPWRYIKEGNVRPGSFLMVSRDGVEWTRYENPYYFSNDWELNGLKVVEALTEHGLVRRGNEIWQFGTVRFTVHGGALYGGEERDGGVHDRFLILKQRLDGFVSLDAGDATGTVLTDPLVFAGRKLQLNLKAAGAVRVAILDESGKPLKGFALEDCDPIQTDSVNYTVTWKKKSNLKSLAGKTVRLKFELQNAKLYAMEFLP